MIPPRRNWEAGATVEQTALVGLEAPHLQSMDVADFVRFKKKRQIYEDVVLRITRKKA